MLIFILIIISRITHHIDDGDDALHVALALDADNMLCIALHCIALHRIASQIDECVMTCFKSTYTSADSSAKLNKYTYNKMKKIEVHWVSFLRKITMKMKLSEEKK